MSQVMLPPDVFYLNRRQQQPRVTVDSLMSRFEFEHSNLGDIVDEMEEETEEFENEICQSILDDEEIMEEDDEQLEEIVFEEEEEEFEVDVSETTLESGNNQVSEYDIRLLNEGYQQQGLNQTSGRRSMTARMRVNTNYIHYRMQVPQRILDEIEDEEEEEEEEVMVEDDTNEFMDQDMSQYFETRTHCAPPTMDTDGDDEEEQEACAICLLEYQDEDTIATLGCGHDFHAECIKKWLSRKKACPFCRASVLPTNT